MPRTVIAQKNTTGTDHVFDAKNKRLGRLASDIARILQGKHRPDYAQNAVTHDRVLVKNVRLVTVGGAKETDKIYYRHTGYMGHLKSKTYEQLFKRSPERLVREAVRRMLPKNFLNTRRLNRLVFIDGE
jgi:large subunit ribosomal protein L13